MKQYKLYDNMNEGRQDETWDDRMSIYTDVIAITKHSITSKCCDFI